jgi:hypothetical protein
VTHPVAPRGAVEDEPPADSSDGLERVVRDVCVGYEEVEVEAPEPLIASTEDRRHDAHRPGVRALHARGFFPPDVE